MMPTKFLLARAVCRNLPPIVAQRVRELIYPRKAAYADNFMFSVKAVTGSEFMGTTQDHHAYPFSVHGYYEWRSWAIAASLCSRGDTVLEVGANLGTETVGFSDIVGPKGKVIAFEPSPANATALKQAVNKFRFTNVEVQEVAVGKNTGKTRFLTSKVKANSGSGHVAFENGKENGFDEIEIGIISLDSLMDRLKNVIYIHMDAEGSELFVLEGANNLIKRDQPAILLEASSKHSYRSGYKLRDLYHKLSDFGYEVYRVERLNLKLIRGEDYGKSNWLCLDRNNKNAFLKVRRAIRLCGLTPNFFPFNPFRNISLKSH